MSWVPLGEAAGLRYCCARGSATTLSLPNNTSTAVTLDTWLARSDSGLYTFSDGGIKVNEAGIYLVGANLYFYCSANAYRSILLVNHAGKTIHQAGYGAQDATPMGAVALAPKAMALSNGTVINLHGKQTNNTTAGKLYPSNLGTYMTIIKIG